MINRYWNNFLSETGKTVALKGTICFGDSHEFADSAAAAILNGTKTAMTYPQNGYRAAMKGMPAVGDHNIVVNWAGEPVCVIETVAVSNFTFSDVPESLQNAEYPGAENWHELKEAESKRELEEIGVEFSESIMIIAEEFRAIYPEKA